MTKKWIAESQENQLILPIICSNNSYLHHEREEGIADIVRTTKKESPFLVPEELCLGILTTCHDSVEYTLLFVCLLQQARIVDRKIVSCVFERTKRRLERVLTRETNSIQAPQKKAKLEVTLIIVNNSLTDLTKN